LHYKCNVKQFHDPLSIRILPQPFFIEHVKSTVRKVMLSAVAGDGQKEKLALQAAPALGLAVVTLH